MYMAHGEDEKLQREDRIDVNKTNASWNLCQLITFPQILSHPLPLLVLPNTALSSEHVGLLFTPISCDS